MLPWGGKRHCGNSRRDGNDTTARSLVALLVAVRAGAGVGAGGRFLLELGGGRRCQRLRADRAVHHTEDGGDFPCRSGAKETAPPTLTRSAPRQPLSSPHHHHTPPPRHSTP